MDEISDKKSKDVLRVIENFGIDWVRASGYHSQLLKYGLEHNLFDQNHVDLSHQAYMEKGAMEVLPVIKNWGIDWVRTSGYHAPLLNYGLVRGFYSKEYVAKLDEEYVRKHCRV